ncbi:MAG: hypothetical protein WDZ82_00730 [Candidatus Paceibacterota bacterium]
MSRIPGETGELGEEVLSDRAVLKNGEELRNLTLESGRPRKMTKYQPLAGILFLLKQPVKEVY